MNILKTCLAATALTAFAAFAQAEDRGIYVNAGVETFEFDVYNIMGRAGYQFTKNISIEGQASFGISSEDISDFAILVDNVEYDVQDASIKVSSAFGGFLRGSLPVADRSSLFARIGYHTTNLGVSADVRIEDFATGDVTKVEVDESLSGDGFAFGIGAEQSFGEASALRIDWTNFDLGGLGDDIEEAGNSIDVGVGGGSANVYSLTYVRKF